MQHLSRICNQSWLHEKKNPNPMRLFKKRYVIEFVGPLIISDIVRTEDPKTDNKGSLFDDNHKNLCHEVDGRNKNIVFYLQKSIL